MMALFSPRPGEPCRSARTSAPGGYPATTSGSGTSAAAAGKQDPNKLRKNLGMRGGVMRAQDGFEVFYGVEGVAKTKPKPSTSLQDARDGFDIFFGIPSRGTGQAPAVAPAKSEDSRPRPQDPKEKLQQQRLVEAQLSARLGTAVPPAPGSSSPVLVTRNIPSSGPQPITATRGGSMHLPAYAAGSPQQQCRPSRPVETFSLCGAHRSPPVPTGVDMYSLATPINSFVPPVVADAAKQDKCTDASKDTGAAVVAQPSEAAVQG